MESHQRGRSPSASRAGDNNLRQSPSPSAQPAFNPQANARGLDPMLLQSSNNPTTNATNSDPGATQSAFSNPSYVDPDFSQQFSTESSISPQDFLSSQNDPFNTSYNQHLNLNPDAQIDPSLGSSFDPSFSLENVNSQYLNPADPDPNQPFDQSAVFDTTSFDDQQHKSPQAAAADDLNFMNAMAQLHQPAQQSQSFIHHGLPHSSESFQSPDSSHQEQFTSPHHSRHQSLDPASAAFPPGSHGSEWAAMSTFRHYRNPSDAYSDTSSQHHPSPYVADADSFEPANAASPMLNGQTDPLFSDVMGIGQFTLSEGYNTSQQHISPGHSISNSPHLTPEQQNLPSFSGPDTFGMLASDQQYMGEPGPPTYNSQNLDDMQNMGSNPEGVEMGQPGQMAAPAINIERAPDRQGTSVNESGGRHEVSPDALSPPSRSPSRARGRARSDPYASASISRTSSPARPRAPSLGLHPTNSRSVSRASSPSGPANGVQKQRGRASSASSVDQNREWMIGLADPNRQQTPGEGSSVGSSPGEQSNSGSRRAQKHPATFQCSICPKRFTRAYNLRSHLRTHTDERPFVCTICGKAFARQHDRKRHEGLHSGEKKFVCKGLLAGGADGAGTWGCGRRFARADALGRHFRSEAGRACIKPLLDEEARERRAAAMDQANQDYLNSGPGQQMGAMGQPSMSGMPGDPNAGDIDTSGITLPAALLAQYPALAGIKWDSVAPIGGPDDGGDFEMDASGRSSFEVDASSGGEWDFEDDGGVGVGMNSYQEQMNSGYGDTSQGMGTWGDGSMGQGMNGQPQQHQHVG